MIIDTLIPRIIDLHKQREGIVDHITEREGNLIVLCLEQFNEFLREKEIDDELIICAAIKLVDSNKIYYGHRHNHALQAANDELSFTLNRQEIAKVKKIQGFITSKNRFINRKDALIIALKRNQILHHDEIRGNDLYSEDLY